MGKQTRFISCGYPVAAFAMVVKFLVGPSIMIATSLAVGLQGLHLRVAIIQVFKLNTCIDNSAFNILYFLLGYSFLCPKIFEFNG